MRYNFVADSHHTKKLCSRLSSTEVRFYTEIGRFAFCKKKECVFVEICYENFWPTPKNYWQLKNFRLLQQLGGAATPQAPPAICLCIPGTAVIRRFNIDDATDTCTYKLMPVDSLSRSSTLILGKMVITVRCNFRPPDVTGVVLGCNF